jgi:hypothetical protein
VCWEYVVPYFSPYHDKEAARLFPDTTIAIFRAYRYKPTRCPGSVPPSRMQLAERRRSG